jgi:hypothetical protein
MRYDTGDAFRTAIEQRLKNRAGGKPLQFLDRQRKMIVFDRYLARLLTVAPGQWIVKGGVALNFRLQERSRMTQDLDLASEADEGVILDYLLDAADTNLGDHFAFSVERVTAANPQQTAEAVTYRVRAELGERPFELVTLDVALSEPLPAVPDIVRGSDFLMFAGIPVFEVPTLPLHRHLAEKVHAYTRTYGAGHPSTRVKDLIDIVLICEASSFSSAELKDQMEMTFAIRATHALPKRLSGPPAHWTASFRAMALEVGINPIIRNGFALVASFLDPVLAGTLPYPSAWNAELAQWG